MENSRYPRHCYIVLKRLDEVGRVTWATHVRTLLCIYGFAYAWQNQGVGNDKHFISLFKDRLRDNLMQEWNTDINSSSKAIHYTLKKSYKRPPHIFCFSSESKIRSI